MTRFSKQLNSILNNKRFGSSELVNQLNDLFESYSSETKVIKSSFPVIKKHLGHFTAVNDYMNSLENLISKNDKDKLSGFFEHFRKNEEDKYETIFKKLYKQSYTANRIITLSRSGTLLNILKLWHKKNKKMKVVICESRPKFEGRFLAEELIENKIKVELITDAMMSLIVPEIDAAVIGADSVLKNGNVINKAGSKALALLCKVHKKPFFVVTTETKLSNKKTFNTRQENASEVWQKQNKFLKVRNIYFEEIEKKLITKIITN